MLPGSDTGLKEANLLGKNLTEEEIASAAANSEHNRTEKFRDHFEHIAICGLWLVAALVLAAALAWFWHLITPESWHWLTADAVGKLQNLLTGGIFATLAAGHLKKRM